MSERAAFISAILDNFADDTPRLVFADWLQEHGEDERAEFVRVQIEAARLPEAERARSKPGVRALALEAVYAPAWRADLGPLGNQGRYDRGFLTGIDVMINRAWAEHIAQLLTVEPAAFTLILPTWVEGEFVTSEDVDRLATNPVLRAVTAISNRDGPVGPDRFARLMKSPHLANLRGISLYEDPIGPEGVRAIVESPSAFVLERLELDGILRFGDVTGASDETPAVELIASAPRFAALKYLSLRLNELGDESVRTLLTSETLPRNLDLDLEENHFDEEQFAEALAERFGRYRGRQNR